MYFGIAMWVFSYLYLAFFGTVSEYLAKTFRIRYLKAVLMQDAEWFEENDPQSLPSRINKDVLSVQAATGEKLANIIVSLSMTVAAFA